jgi:large subunit ribosomal protein L11
MAEIKTKVKVQLQGAAATPAPPVGTVLGPHGVNLMEFCKAFNALTAQKKGQTVPAIITIFKNRTFEITIKTPPTTELIKNAVSIKKGSAKPAGTTVGKITMKQIEEIAKIKLPDLNANSLEGAMKIIAGSARSMGVEVVNG